MGTLAELAFKEKRIMRKDAAQSVPEGEFD